MERENAVLANDLMIMEEMATSMADYLDSDVVNWTIPSANMPKLTLGGYLMRQHRLLALQKKLTEGERSRLAEVVQEFQDVLDERIVRLEKRAHQELHMRVAEWIGILRDLKRHSQTEVNYYAGVVDIRVVIEHLLNRLRMPPYRLNEGVLDEVEAIDKLLKTQFEAGKFVWDPIWLEAYPSNEFWWLHGHPK